MRRVRAARMFLEKFDPTERKERTVELQEQAEVFAQVMKEHFIKLFTPPHFSSCPPWVLNPLPVSWRRGNLLGKLNIDGVERNCCIRSPFIEVG